MKIHIRLSFLSMVITLVVYSCTPKAEPPVLLFKVYDLAFYINEPQKETIERLSNYRLNWNLEDSEYIIDKPDGLYILSISIQGNLAHLYFFEKKLKLIALSFKKEDKNCWEIAQGLESCIATQSLDTRLVVYDPNFQYRNGWNCP